jgi:hypothetical protein
MEKMFRRRHPATPETTETRNEVQAAQHRHAREQAIGALSVLNPNVG